MLRRLTALVPLVTLALACASPTLPLPPPVEPEEGLPPDADHIKLVASCGGELPDVVIVVITNSPGGPNDEAVSGAKTSDCGAWDAVVYAHSGDVLEIVADLGAAQSQPLLYQVPKAGAAPSPSARSVGATATAAVLPTARAPSAPRVAACFRPGRRAGRRRDPSRWPA